MVYVILYYITLHYTTLHYTTVHCTLHYTILYYCGSFMNRAVLFARPTKATVVSSCHYAHTLKCMRFNPLARVQCGATRHLAPSSRREHYGVWR